MTFIAFGASGAGCFGHSSAGSSSDAGADDAPMFDVSMPSDAQPNDAQPFDAQQPLDAQPMDAQPMDAQPMDAQPMDARALDAGALDAQPAADATADAGMPDSAADSAPDSAAEASATGLYVDAVNGSDQTGTGTQAMPFQTLDKALQVVLTGQSVLLEPGTYTATSRTVPDGANVAAVTAGQSTIQGGAGIVFAGSGTLSGVVVSGGAVAASSGNVSVQGVLFAGSGSLSLTGTAHVVMTPGTLNSYIAAGWSASMLAYIQGGSLQVLGGSVLNASGIGYPDGVFTVGDNFGQCTNCSLLLDHVTIDSPSATAVKLNGPSTATLQNGTTINKCAGSVYAGAITLEGSPTLILDGAKITNTQENTSCGAGVAGCGAITDRNPVNATVTVRNNSLIDGDTYNGINLVSGTVTIDGSTLSNHKGGYGVYLDSNAAKLTVTNSIITGNATGLAIYASAPTATIRGTKIIANAGDGISLYGTSVMSWTNVDLGTSTSLGGNAFSGNNTSAGAFANLHVGQASAATSMNAIGNTWDANTQGASATGQYTSPTTFSSPPKVNGTNVIVEGSTGAPTVSVTVK